MQNANTILSILHQKSVRNKQYVFDRVYRNIFNPDFFMEAYRKIYAKPGNMTAGTDGKTIDGFKKSKVDELITKLRNEQYYPTPVRRVYIPKKNSKKKKRPLGIPSFEDKLVQEVVRKMLDAIYEPIFLDTSHGFRPNRSCQTAFFQVKSNCRGTKWVVEGDITGCFDNVDHDILLQITGEHIMTYFNDSLKKMDEPNTALSDKYCPDVMTGRQLINRLNANVCEVCGTNEGEFEVHHVRKLKDIKDKFKRRGKAIPGWVLTMSRIRRKTLIVCECCHHGIHSGKY